MILNSNFNFVILIFFLDDQIQKTDNAITTTQISSTSSQSSLENINPTEDWKNLSKPEVRAYSVQTCRKFITEISFLFFKWLKYGLLAVKKVPRDGYQLPKVCRDIAKRGVKMS